MLRTTLVALAASLLLFAGSAQANVTRSEYRDVHLGMNKSHVQKLWHDTGSTIRTSSDGVGTLRVKRYKIARGEYAKATYYRLFEGPTVLVKKRWCINYDMEGTGPNVLTCYAHPWP